MVGDSRRVLWAQGGSLTIGMTIDRGVCPRVDAELALRFLRPSCCSVAAGTTTVVVVAAGPAAEPIDWVTLDHWNQLGRDRPTLTKRSSAVGHRVFELAEQARVLVLAEGAAIASAVVAAWASPRLLLVVVVVRLSQQVCLVFAAAAAVSAAATPDSDSSPRPPWSSGLSSA